MNFRSNKKSNEYADQIESDLYCKIPKAVFAAIAVSALTCGGDEINEAQKRVLVEWENLYTNGIVSQRPPRGVRRKE